jgi:hypothetical protein
VVFVRSVIKVVIGKDIVIIGCCYNRRVNCPRLVMVLTGAGVVSSSTGFVNRDFTVDGLSDWSTR